MQIVLLTAAVSGILAHVSGSATTTSSPPSFHESRVALVCARLIALPPSSPNWYNAMRRAVIGTESARGIDDWIEDSKLPHVLEAIKECAGLTGPSLTPRQTRLVELLSVGQLLAPSELESMTTYNGWSAYFGDTVRAIKGGLALINERGIAYPIWQETAGSFEASRVASNILVPYIIDQARICMSWLPLGGDATCRTLLRDSTRSAMWIAATMVAILTDKNCADLATMWGIDVPKLTAELADKGVRLEPGCVSDLRISLTAIGSVKPGTEMMKFLETNRRQFRPKS